MQTGVAHAHDISEDKEIPWNNIFRAPGFIAVCFQYLDTLIIVLT